MLLVVDNEFNQANYPDLIGKVFENPPGFAAVVETDAGKRAAQIMREVDDSLLDMEINRKYQ